MTGWLFFPVLVVNYCAVKCVNYPVLLFLRIGKAKDRKLCVAYYLWYREKGVGLFVMFCVCVLFC